jgi:photosystem II stability/assembly factor-like uncharacterized protein
VARLAFTDARTGLLVTDRGGISRTLDGGRSWRQTLLTDDEWFVPAMSWASARTVYAVTMQDGSLIRSDDAGAHWRRVAPVGPGVPTGAVSFSSPQSGIGLGSSRILVPDGVAATSDGGVTWRHVADLANVHSYWQLVRSGRSTVWATGFRVLKTGGTHSFLIHSSDDGRHWRERPAPRGLGIGATLSFPTQTVGFAAGPNGLFRTDDGSSSWQRVRTARRDLRGAVFVTPSEGLLAGLAGLLRTDDGGRSWSQVQVKSSSLSGPFVLDARHWWLEGRDGLLRTTDGGRTWTAIRLPAVSEFNWLDFVTPKVGYAGAGEAGLYRTDDGGRTWRFVKSR